MRPTNMGNLYSYPQSRLFYKSFTRFILPKDQKDGLGYKTIPTD